MILGQQILVTGVAFILLFIFSYFDFKKSSPTCSAEAAASFFPLTELLPRAALKRYAAGYALLLSMLLSYCIFYSITNVKIVTIVNQLVSEKLKEFCPADWYDFTEEYLRLSANGPFGLFLTLILAALLIQPYVKHVSRWCINWLHKGFGFRVAAQVTVDKQIENLRRSGLSVEQIIRSLELGLGPLPRPEKLRPYDKENYLSYCLIYLAREETASRSLNEGISHKLQACNLRFMPIRNPAYANPWGYLLSLVVIGIFMILYLSIIPVIVDTSLLNGIFYYLSWPGKRGFKDLEMELALAFFQIPISIWFCLFLFYARRSRLPNEKIGAALRNVAGRQIPFTVLCSAVFSFLYVLQQNSEPVKKGCVSGFRFISIENLQIVLMPSIIGTFFLYWWINSRKRRWQGVTPLVLASLIGGSIYALSSVCYECLTSYRCTAALNMYFTHELFLGTALSFFSMILWLVFAKPAVVWPRRALPRQATEAIHNSSRSPLSPV